MAMVFHRLNLYAQIFKEIMVYCKRNNLSHSFLSDWHWRWQSEVAWV